MIILFLIGALGLGRLAVNSLHLTWHRFEAWALVVVFGYFFSAWALLIACSLLGFKIGAAIVVALMLAAWILPQARHTPDRLSLATARQTAVWLVMTCILSAGIILLMSRQNLPCETGGLYSFDWDLPLHLSIMTNVAYTPHFNWRFTLMGGTYLTYPFLIDFLSGMLVRWGGSLRFALLAVSIPLSLAMVQLLFFLELRIFRSVRAAALFATIFLLSGSSGGFIAAISDFLHSHASFWAFFSKPPLDYSNDGFYHYGDFISITLDTQRGFQFGITIFCSALLLILQLNKTQDALMRRRILGFTGLIIGLLPLAHIHSFLMSFVALVAIAVFDRKIAAFREWLVIFGTSLAFAIPQLIYQLFANRHASFLRYHPGWMYDPRDFPNYSHNAGLLLFILANFGAILLMIFFGYRSLKNCSMVRGLYLLGICLSVAAFILVFQPNNYDNIKFLIYAVFFFCLGIAQYLALLSRAGRWQWVPVTLVLIASGTLGLIWNIGQHPIMYPDRALREAREYRQALPINAVVLASAYHQHPLWALAGQPVVEGETDYLFDYGLPWVQLQRDVQAMYAGGPDAIFLLQKYRVQYVLISRYERNNIRFINEPFFIRNFPLIYYRDGMSIYQIRRASS